MSKNGPKSPRNKTTAKSPRSQSSSKPTTPRGGDNPKAKTKEDDSQMARDLRRVWMNPMLAELERKIQENNRVMDEMNRKWREEKEAERKLRLSEHIPEPLKGHGQNLEDIIKHLEDLMVYENYVDGLEEQKLIPAKLRLLDENAEVAILSHGLSAYVSLLEPSHLKHFTNNIVEDTSLWLSRMFRFDDAAVFYHEDEREGLIRLCRLALHKKFPKYLDEGYEALYSRPPVIYLSSAAKAGMGDYLCAQLGLPSSCLSTIPCSIQPGCQHKMDTTALEQQVEDDVTSARTPLLVLGYAGTPVIAQVDDIEKIQSICKKHQIWFHVEGHHLATLAMYSVPTNVSPVKTGDSITLNLGCWLGLPSLPYVTLYKTADSTQAYHAGLTSLQTHYKLSCLPIWVCLQNLGHEGVVNRIKLSVDLAEKMHEKLMGHSSLQEVSNRAPPKPEAESEGLGHMLSKAINALLTYEISSPSVVFKYSCYASDAPPEVASYAKNAPKPVKIPAKMPERAPYAAQETSANHVPSSTQSEDGAEPPTMSVGTEESYRHEDYFDALNIWLAETLKREVSTVHLDTIEVPNEGLCIRFSPLENAQVQGTTLEDMEVWGKSLGKQVSILNATVKQKENFQEVVEAQDNLRLVHLPTWAGLGAVQYIPDHWIDKLDALTAAAKREINHLNTELVKQLKSSDTAFSLGRAEDGLVCARFGLITEETDMEELIGLVYTTAKEIEESSKFLEKMSEIVRKGIEAANEDLKKENEEKLIQEGLLRHVPLVGSLVSWWSPPPKETGVKGRTFNLASGKVHSTEETYKYHMQIQEASPDALQPKPKQGPLKANLKPARHHSTSSQGSVVENGPAQGLKVTESSVSSLSSDSHSKPEQGVEGGEASPPPQPEPPASPVPKEQPAAAAESTS
ncbi:putative pyridoxal-dependent decarboxylase domain-containing protein 2 isoform X2 [Lingula anatina]|uniref:Pyridoxal-dependent decarboxylase domain-containing protein 1 n=1 Tax=Lingula anatina TaxID=7574 RepID=A0A1S3K002_LINAN|nr:putative pyridoxal-dependent decarboxylase domain-containing protein 2 isoform X2 [Lingula anatina]|eukprot:XP_013415606.1 putative pyridoxal-dependent decarboxylase domain-containing protein 2 isoform X2 [Lingula anatina]